MPSAYEGRVRSESPNGSAKPWVKINRGSRLKTGAGIQSWLESWQRAEFFALPIWTWHPIAPSRGFWR